MLSRWIATCFTRQRHIPQYEQYETSTFASSCLNRCTILKTERRHRKEGLSPGIKVLANHPPIAKLQNCLTEVSVAQTSSPQWPKSLCKATTELEGFRRLSSLHVDRGQLKIECLQMPLFRNSLVIYIFFYVFIYFLTCALTYELLLVLTLFHFSCQDFSASNFKHVFWGYLTYYPMLSASVWS